MLPESREHCGHSTGRRDVPPGVRGARLHGLQQPARHVRAGHRRLHLRGGEHCAAAADCKVMWFFFIISLSATQAVIDFSDFSNYVPVEVKYSNALNTKLVTVFICQVPNKGLAPGPERLRDDPHRQLLHQGPEEEVRPLEHHAARHH